MGDVAVVGNGCILFCSKGVVEAELQDCKIIVSMGAVSNNVKWKLLAGRKVRKQYVCLKGTVFSQQRERACTHVRPVIVNTFSSILELLDMLYILPVPESQPLHSR
jgi:hypothetical protein